jgi:hypothetical protein
MLGLMNSGREEGKSGNSYVVCYVKEELNVLMIGSWMMMLKNYREL